MSGIWSLANSVAGPGSWVSGPVSPPVSTVVFVPVSVFVLSEGWLSCPGSLLVSDVSPVLLSVAVVSVSEDVSDVLLVLPPVPSLPQEVNTMQQSAIATTETDKSSLIL